MDVAIRLGENFIYNMEELEGLNRHDLNAFKAMVSQEITKERRGDQLIIIIREI